MLAVPVLATPAVYRKHKPKVCERFPPATEELLQRHLEAILSNNRQAVTAALQREIKNILNAHRRRSKANIIIIIGWICVVRFMVPKVTRGEAPRRQTVATVTTSFE